MPSLRFPIACAIITLCVVGAATQAGIADTIHTWVPGNVSLPLPRGAVFAGLDPDWYNIYVGRLHPANNGVYPAKIKLPTGAIYLAGTTSKYWTKSYDILIATDGRSYEWVRSFDGHLERNAVSVGTSSSGERVYICRVLLDGAVVMGNLFGQSRVCAAKHDSYVESDKYEVLVEV
ncbi:uncharacterized protein LOC115622297 [Scaptodrosophila lebanonensis]|uniref:Uncharacterized protein LOC115622297 n=1 Tax=Drosophila lebanonensis TaxID=7225 RepID=A0A6J2T9Q8_DROLE|nr:uncharacterized protein LOC115622297 [Scaptodrosophila lebanonensis]